MAIYHLHCDIIGRSGGRSATAAAAYRATCAIEDRTTGEKFDYSRKEKAVFSEILTNGNAPEWATDRAELWNRVEEKENRKNSQFCRSFDIALMKEFDLETNLKLIEKWAKENYVSRGLVADIAIHSPHKNTDGTTNENTHAHILIPTRKMDSNGWTEKDRDANDRNFLKAVRTSWAEIVNAEFKARGMSERIDERTLEEQGIDREPQQHQGVTATAMKRKGKNTNRKKYKSEEQKQDNIIRITEAELQTVLEADEEYKRLKELLGKAKQAEPEIQELKKWADRIKKMTPKEWQSFTKNMGVSGLVDSAYGEYTQTIFEADRKAREIWVKDNIEPITKEFEKNYKDKKKEWENYLSTKPTQIAERPNAVKAFFYIYETDDGQKFKGSDFDQYRMAQQSIINKWEYGKAKPESEYNVAKSELKACYDKKYGEVKTAIERHHPNLWQSMREGATKLLQKLEEFRPVRAMVSAVQHFKEQKNNELKAWNQEQKRLRDLTKGQDREQGGRGY